MKAIILAAGEGKRLRPLTNDVPKCMISLFGKSLLERQIETFSNCTIYDITVVTGYRSDKINIPNIRYFRNDNYNTTNMVETLFCAKEIMNDSIIVSYGDIIFQKNVLQKLISSNDDFSVVIDKDWLKYWKIRFKNPLDDAENLKIDEDGYIKNIGQKVSSVDEIMGQYIGLMKFQNKGLEFLKKYYEVTKNRAKTGSNPLNPTLPFEKSFMTDLLSGLIKEDCKIKAVPINNGWLELDTSDDFQLYEKMYRDESLKAFFSSDV